MLLLALVSANEEGEIVPPQSEGNTATTERRRAILNGNVVYGQDYPFFALLYGARGTDFDYFCGGVLISHNAVLTAASCFNNRNRMSFVRLGGNGIFDGEEIDVDEIIIHPRFRNNGDILEYDFAVLKLKESAVTKPARLNTEPRFPNVGGEMLETLGYGVNIFRPEPYRDHKHDSDDYYNDDLTSDLRLEQVDLGFVTFGSCQETYFPPDEGRRLSEKATISDNLHLCAKPVFPNTGPCLGDEGGPLLFDGDIVVGIYSFGSSCDGAEVNVFAELAANIYWIFNQAGIPQPTPFPTPVPTPHPTKEPTKAPYHKPTHPTHPTYPYDTPWWHCDTSTFFTWAEKPVTWMQGFFGGAAQPQVPDEDTSF